ncbi:MAG: hypothetical protein JSV05_10000 [Candidatus Bathyarchaeota archaeon]|nr:MAG: hypothetical protein JSV05_10000 [Candidatus Bathyarchaeota archaeon]
MAKRRTKYEIFSDLLDIVARKGYCRLTRASYGANLPVDRAKKSLTFLASRGFLKEEDADGSKVYKITKRGLEYLETFRQMHKLFAALDEKISPPQARPSIYLAEPKPKSQIHTKITLSKNQAKIGEKIELEFKISNMGRTPATFVKIEELFPRGFAVLNKSSFNFEDNNLNMNLKRLDPLMIEEIRLTLRPLEEGVFVVKPKIFYVEENGYQNFCESEPQTINILEEDLSKRVSTGYKELDNLLLGGIPLNYAVILTSISCDERDLLVRKFIESGVKEDNITFYVTFGASGMKPLTENFQSNFYLFICNPQADQVIESLPNVFKLKGVENLTEISIALTSAFRKLDKSSNKRRRACIEIISDVLLQHHAVQTRRWLTGIITELKSKGFTTLSVMNPQMHTSEEVQAILDLFEGEINIHEKEGKRVTKKFLRIKKMYNQRYLESEMPLIKERIQS